MSDDIQDLSRTQVIFRMTPNWMTAPERDFSLNRVVHESGPTTVSLTELNDLLVHSVRGTYLCDREIANRILVFFAGRLGRTRRFWLPVWKNSFSLHLDAIRYDSYLLVNDTGASTAFQGHERVFIYTTTGDLITRHVTSVVAGVSGTEVFNLESVLNCDISMTDVACFGRCLLVRFDDDALSFQHKASGVSEVAIKFVELVREYSVGGAES